MYFIDTSALAKRYVSERGTETIQKACLRLEGSLYISWLVAAETLAVLARLRRSDVITVRQYRKGRDEFLNDLPIDFRVLDFGERETRAAIVMIDTYRDRRVSGADLLHLATAEALQANNPGVVVRLMCCDRGMRDVARARGFEVFDPETDPLGDLVVT